MSRKNNRDTEDYYNDPNDDRRDYQRGPKPIRPIIEDDRHKTKPNYVAKDQTRDNRHQVKEEKPKHESKPYRQ